MPKTNFLCDSCFHPVLQGQSCPYCHNERQTKECKECNNIMLAIPTQLNKEKVQYICQQCAFEKHIEIK